LSRFIAPAARRTASRGCTAARSDEAGRLLINTARGNVVDTTALIEALRLGSIAGARLDVYEGEPSVPASLTALQNVVLLPHLGSATAERRTEMGMKVVENITAFFDGRDPPDRVA
jgi:lactate dehydrogenase-like 2-hydroxyacid dehydrogenase